MHKTRILISTLAWLGMGCSGWVCWGTPEAPSALTGAEIHSTSSSAEEPLPPLEEEVPSGSSWIASTVPAGGVDLAGLLDLALRSSPKLSVERAKVGETRMRALATGLLPNPVVEGGAKKVSGEHSGPVVRISQELPINGALGLERQAAGLELMADQAQLSRGIQSVLAEVMRAYVSTLATRELAGVEQHGLELAEGFLRHSSETYHRGLSGALPFELARVEVAGARTANLLVLEEYANARKNLALLIGLTEAGLPQVAGNLRASLLPADTASRKPSRPDLEAASLRIQAAQAAVAAAERARIPNPVIGYEREEAGDDTENFFTLGLEIPLFNSGRPRVQERIAEQQTAHAEKSALAREIESELERTTSQLEIRRQAVEIYENEISPSIRQSLETARSALDQGLTDRSLLLQAQVRLVEQERNAIRALSELREAEIDYLLALGATTGQ